MTTVATEPRPRRTKEIDPRPVGSASPALCTHGDCAIGEFLVMDERDPSAPRGADWANVINPWYLYDFEEAEFNLDKGRLVALPCAAEEDRAALEVALASAIQLAVQTHHDARRGLLWVRKARRGAAACVKEEPVAATV